MAAPLALGMLARGGVEIGKYLAAAGIPGLTFGLLAQPKEYERNFDYSFYDSDHERFYDASLITDENPLGFNRPLFLEQMDIFHKIKPMY